MKAKGITFEIYEGFGQNEIGIWSAPDGRAKMAWFLDPDGNNLSISEHAAGWGFSKPNPYPWAMDFIA
jgi:hypothetical protein